MPIALNMYLFGSDLRTMHLCDSNLSEVSEHLGWPMSRGRPIGVRQIGGAAPAHDQRWNSLCRTGGPCGLPPVRRQPRRGSPRLFAWHCGAAAAGVSAAEAWHAAPAAEPEPGGLPRCPGRRAALCPCNMESARGVAPLTSPQQHDDTGCKCEHAHVDKRRGHYHSYKFDAARYEIKQSTF